MSCEKCIYKIFYSYLYEHTWPNRRGTLYVNIANGSSQ